MASMGIDVEEELNHIEALADVVDALGELMNQTMGRFIREMDINFATNIKQLQPKVMRVNNLNTTLIKNLSRSDTIIFSTQKQHFFEIGLAIGKLTDQE